MDINTFLLQYSELQDKAIRNMELVGTAMKQITEEWGMGFYTTSEYYTKLALKAYELGMVSAKEKLIDEFLHSVDKHFWPEVNREVVMFMLMSHGLV